MKKHALIFVAVLLAVAIAMPAFAAVEFKYGGEFKARFTSENNTIDGTDMRGFYGPSYNSDDNRLAIDQRLRLYFTFVGSPNLKLVTKFEIGTSIWGQGGIFNAVGRTGPNLGTNEGGDAVAVEVKNVYIEFNIPNTPSTALIGVQTTNLLDSWIINDDLPAAVLVTKLDPFKITAGYVAGQNGWERTQGDTLATGIINGGGVSPFTQPTNSSLSATDQTYNVDDIFLALDYAAGPFKASLVGFYQNGHDSTLSADPGTLGNPVSVVTAASMGTFFADNGVFANYSSNGAWHLQNNQFFDLGLNLQYKVDWLLAYVSFVKNLGGFDIVGRPGGPFNSQQNPANPFPTSAANNAATALIPFNGAASANAQSPNYTGWMVDAGVTYFCGPWSVNVGGFYTTGPDIDSVVANNGGMGSNPATGAPFGNTNKPFNGLSSTDVNWFTYPLAQTKYSSEIMGGGVLGDDWADGSFYVQRGTRWGAAATSVATGGAGIGSAAALSSMYWRNYPSPSNIWTISAGGSYQLTPTTKFSGSYWYWHTASDVPIAFASHSLLTTTNPLGTAANPLTYKMDGSIGHELDFYLDQQIVDGLTLTIVGAYLFADDAYTPLPFMSPAAGQMGASNFVNAVNSGNYYTNHSDNAYKLGARLLWAF